MSEAVPNTLALIHTELNLYDVALQTPTAGEEVMDVTRLDSLYLCLDKVKEAVDLLYAIPAAVYGSFPLTVIVQFSHTFMSLYGLSVMEYPGWDRAAVRNTADIMSLAEHVAMQYEQYVQDLGIENAGADQDVARNMARAMRRLKAGWANVLPPFVSASATAPGFDQNFSLPFLQGFFPFPDSDIFSETTPFWGLPLDPNVSLE